MGEGGKRKDNASFDYPEPSLWNSPFGRRAFLKKTGAATASTLLIMHGFKTEVLASESPGIAELPQVPLEYLRDVPAGAYTWSPTAAGIAKALWDCGTNERIGELWDIVDAVNPPVYSGGGTYTTYAAEGGGFTLHVTASGIATKTVAHKA